MQKDTLKPRVLILHGWGGSDFPHWQSWLASRLALRVIRFIFLDSLLCLPLEKVWLQSLEDIMDTFRPDRVVSLFGEHMVFKMPKNTQKES